MPRLLSEESVVFERSDLEKRSPIRRPSLPLSRAPGAHQSLILQHIAHKIGILKPGERSEEEYPLIWGLGQAWEEWVVSFYPNLKWQPGEKVVDGIAVNCDGISRIGGREMLEECKFTFKRERTGEEFLQEWMWMHQGRAYSYVYGPRTVRWHVCYVRGNYKEFGPTYKRYVVQFSEQEVEQTWQMLQRNKEEAMREAGVSAAPKRRMRHRSLGN